MFRFPIRVNLSSSMLTHATIEMKIILLRMFQFSFHKRLFELETPLNTITIVNK